ncbi:hypothetical protein KM043_009563 [Ampulex compressa]|nr:hypothetical protein KM043_009563 [Ampulex compressa]
MEGRWECESEAVFRCRMTGRTVTECLLPIKWLAERARCGEANFRETMLRLVAVNRIFNAPFEVCSDLSAPHFLSTSAPTVLNGFDSSPSAMAQKERAKRRGLEEDEETRRENERAETNAKSTQLLPASAFWRGDSLGQL